jgi:selenocysteine lyase/cysteine desulfurase
MEAVSDLEPYLASFDVDPGYLNWAAFGPLSPSVRAEVAADTEMLGTGRATGIDLVSARVDEARDLVAEHLGSDPSEVTLQPSTTHGLVQALAGLEGGLLVSPAEFPALTVSARRLQDGFGRLRVHDLVTPAGIVTVDAVRDGLTDDVTAVAVSLVDFRTGALADLAGIRDVIGERLLIVDAVQAFGVVETDWAAADVVCGNGYKWLRAGRGTGFARFSARARERIEPVLSGWAGTDIDLAGTAIGAPAASGAAYALAPVDPLAAGRLAVALREVRDAGARDVAGTVRRRAQDVMALADRYGMPVLTPRDAHAGIVTLLPAEHDAGRLAAALANHGVTATARGGAVRISAHAGTGADALTLLGDALAEVAVTGVSPMVIAP